MTIRSLAYLVTDGVQAHSMDPESLRRKIEAFLICNLSYLQSIEGDPHAELAFLQALRRYLGGHLSLDDCRQLFAQSHDFRELLATGKKYWAEEVGNHAMNIEKHLVFQTPVDVFLSNSDLRYKELMLLTDLTRLVISIQNLDLKNSLTRQDFSISKEKVITSYLKFFSLKTQFLQIKNKLIAIQERKRAQEGQKHMVGLKESHNQKEWPTLKENSQPQTCLAQTSSLEPNSNSNVIEIQILQFLQKVNGLLEHHSKFLWVTQFTLANLHEGANQTAVKNGPQAKSRSQSTDF